MNTLTRHIFAPALILICLGIQAAAQPQTKPFKKAPTGTVSGRVTIKGKGTSGVVIALRQNEFTYQPAPSPKATTDQEGNYRITDIPAGNYQISPIAPAFVLSDLNNSGLSNYGSRGRGKSLVIAEGEDVESIDFALVRGGVITGKVTDADGRPLIEESITLLPEASTNERGTSDTMPPMFFQTDDRGIYRMFGVPAGRYRVAVGQTGNDLYRTMGGRPSYKQTFHPDVTDPAKATLVEVSEGLEITNVDISVGRAQQTFAASGRVVESGTGQPVANLRFGIRMLNEEGGSADSTNATSNSQGEFRIENLPPGKYEVMVMPFQGSDFLSDSVPFEILNQNVIGLLLKASIGASVSGKVLLEGTHDKNVLTRLAQLRLQVDVRSENPSSGFGQSSEIGLDGSFRAGGLSAGTATFYLGGEDRSLLKGFVISRIERDGSVQPRELEIKTGEQITGVRVVISYSSAGSGVIRGTVKFENGSLPPGSHIAVRLAKQGENQFNMNPSQQLVDSRGRFFIDGLAAGNYELNVMGYLQGWRNRPPSAKQEVNVGEGAVTEVTITLDLKADEPKPNP
jgi:hypothetical protein